MGEAALSRDLERRVAIVIQARMGSTRFPGKVLAPILGRPLIAYQLERLARIRTPARLVVATTDRPTDDPIVRFCSTIGVETFRGAEEDVLARFVGAAAAVGADIVVRSTADCPLIDPEVVDKVVERVRAGGCEYASNTVERTFPRGLDVEAMERRVLDIAAQEATDPAERGHVTPFIYRRPERFRLCSVTQDHDLSSERWTVDTPADFELIRRILEALYPVRPGFGCEDVVRLLDENSDWRSLNADVEQKPLALPSRPPL